MEQEVPTAMRTGRPALWRGQNFIDGEVYFRDELRGSAGAALTIPAGGLVQPPPAPQGV